MSSALPAVKPFTSARKINVISCVDGSTEPEYFSTSRWLSRKGDMLKLSSISIKGISSGVDWRITNGAVGRSSIILFFRFVHYASILRLFSAWEHQNRDERVA